MGSSEEAGSTVDRVYEELKGLAISYAIKPGTRLNEGEVARRLGVSRTPLREALNRLTAAGFLNFAPHQGFFGKPLDPAEIADLYEMRVVIETASVRLAALRASPEDLDEIEAFLAVSARSTSEHGIDQLVRFDEGFHERIVKLTGNRQMLACLANVNERIRFFRWMDLEDEERKDTQEEHRQVLLALRAQDGERAASMLDTHIGRRRDQIVAQVREGYARIYVGGETTRGLLNGFT
jgi:DNA-binding GntR family transcriptional regulator